MFFLVLPFPFCLLHQPCQELAVVANDGVSVVMWETSALALCVRVTMAVLMWLLSVCECVALWSCAIVQ